MKRSLFVRSVSFSLALSFCPARAGALLEDSFKDQDGVDEMAREIQAKTEAVQAAGQKEMLKALIEQAESIENESFTQSSASLLEEKLDAARTQLAEESFQLLRKAYDELFEALENLSPKPDPDDIKRLQELYSTVENLGLSEYEENGASAFLEAKKAARAVLSDRDSSQDQVDRAISDLKKAKDDLSRKKPVQKIPYPVHSETIEMKPGSARQMEWSDFHPECSSDNPSVPKISGAALHALKAGKAKIAALFPEIQTRLKTVITITVLAADENRKPEPDSEQEKPTVMHRLYNPNSGEHFHTKESREKDYPIQAEWSCEGIGWYSDDQKNVPLYRQYNPNAKAGAHNCTISINEHNYLIANGWNDEGIAWYGLK